MGRCATSPMPIRNLIENGRLNRSATTESLQKLLQELIRAAKLNLNVTVHALKPEMESDPGGAEVFADINGRDKDLLLERGGELLLALEHLALKSLRLEPPFQDKLFFDCDGFRAVRIEELKMTARVAADRVQSSRQPFKLNPMSSRERRIVHLALQDFPGVRTESAGSGPHRQVVIYPADAAKR